MHDSHHLVASQCCAYAICPISLRMATFSSVKTGSKINLIYTFLFIMFFKKKSDDKIKKKKPASFQYQYLCEPPQYIPSPTQHMSVVHDMWPVAYNDIVFK